MFPEGKLIAVDTETTGLYCQLGHKPFMWSFANKNEEATCVGFRVEPTTRKVLYEEKPKEFEALRRFLADPSITKVFFNALFDVSMCETAGLKVAGKVEDASLALRIVGIPRNFWKLKPFAKKYLKISDDDESDLKKMIGALKRRAKKAGWWFDNEDEADYWLTHATLNPLIEGAKVLKSWPSISHNAMKMAALADDFLRAEELCRKYARTDAVRTIVGWFALREALKDSEQEEIYEEEMRSVFPVVKSMYDVGIKLDMHAVDEGLARAKRGAKNCMHRLHEILGDEFNPGSYPQKYAYFIEEKKMTPLSYTPAGQPTLDKHFMEHYADEDEVCGLINEHSTFVKSASTYFGSFKTLQRNEVLHDRMSQIGTVTGRFSGWLQTIPKRAKEGSIMLDVRRCFVPRPGHWLVCMDYSQIEARIFADEFGEDTMIAAFAANRDVYSELKEVILRETGVSLLRQIAKNIFLGKLYGLGKAKMIKTIRAASDVEIANDECEEVIYAFDSTFPTVGSAMRQTEKLARSQGYVENRYGQRVPVDADFSYRGVNYIIQPTAARLMKRAMWKCWEFLQYYAGVGDILLQIHDELLFEIPRGRGFMEIVEELQRIMEDNDGMFPQVSTPVEVDVCRKNWLDRRPLYG